MGHHWHPFYERLHGYPISSKIPSRKAMVLYMTCLDILSMALEEKDIPHADLNGQMTLRERTDIVQMFQDEKDQSMPKVLCGSYGLTLTAASTVILLNNSWTPLIRCTMHRTRKSDRAKTSRERVSAACGAFHEG